MLLFLSPHHQGGSPPLVIQVAVFSGRVGRPTVNMGRTILGADLSAGQTNSRYNKTDGGW
ncbi:MAG: hypothetical protein J6C23_06360 [Clostridia bacterium]|nr:hypothetical protein [Clostridia bacterium]